MNNDQRLKASQDQIKRFFYSYYSNWRYAKILINEKVLQNKYNLLQDIAKEIKQPEEDNLETLITQEITNGLHFDTVSNCVQYIEDLFALLKAAKDKEFFIKNIVTYNAGKIENEIKKEHKDKELCDLFYFPHFTEFDSEDFKAAFEEGLNKLKNRIDRIKEFYKAYHFFYIQYKHGLTVALRPYANLKDEHVQKDKKGEMSFNIVAFDNLSLNKVYNNKHRFQDYAFLPCITDNTKDVIKDLEAEDNLIRFVFSPPHTNIYQIKECAFLVKECMHVFINNLLAVLNDTDVMKLQLPMDKGEVMNFKFPVVKPDKK